MDYVQGTIGQFIDALFKHGPAGVAKWWHSRRQQRKLREMLADSRFPKGFRSTKQLMDGIGADEETTKRLLLAIGARKSETTDEWTMNPPPAKRAT